MRKKRDKSEKQKRRSELKKKKKKVVKEKRQKDKEVLERENGRREERNENKEGKMKKKKINAFDFCIWIAEHSFGQEFCCIMMNLEVKRLCFLSFLVFMVVHVRGTQCLQNF